MAKAVSWAQAVVALAGPAAEQKFFGCAHDTRDDDPGLGLGDRLRTAEHWLSQIRGVSFAQVERMATHLVSEHMCGTTRCIKCRPPYGQTNRSPRFQHLSRSAVADNRATCSVV
jgi:hypothetical protein